MSKRQKLSESLGPIEFTYESLNQQHIGNNNYYIYFNCEIINHHNIKRGSLVDQITVKYEEYNMSITFENEDGTPYK